MENLKLHEFAYNKANKDGKSFLLDYVNEKYNKILNIFDTNRSWFFIQAKSINTGNVYFYSISYKDSGASSSHFGDASHLQSVFNNVGINKKPIVKICPNGMIKYFDCNGKRNLIHPTGFYNLLNKDYLVIY